MTTPTALVILHDQFEELEAVAPIDILRRAGVTVTVASREFALTVKSRGGLSLLADERLETALQRDYDLLVLPGGPGVFQRLRHDERVRQAVRDQVAAGKLVGAICAAPLVLLDAGLIAGKAYTAHPSAREELPGEVTPGAVVEDGWLISAPGPGAAIAFGLALAARLTSAATADQVAADMCV